jgi:hypothetical protein
MTHRYSHAVPSTLAGGDCLTAIFSSLTAARALVRPCFPRKPAVATGLAPGPSDHLASDARVPLLCRHRGPRSGVSTAGGRRAPDLPVSTVAGHYPGVTGHPRASLPKGESARTGGTDVAGLRCWRYIACTPGEAAPRSAPKHVTRTRKFGAVGAITHKHPLGFLLLTGISTRILQTVDIASA